MKRIYLLFLFTAALTVNAFAQIDLQTTMQKPTAGTTFDAGKYYPFEITVKVVSGNITPQDTVWYSFTDAGGQMWASRFGLTKGPGDTIIYKTTVGYGAQATPKTNYHWCGFAVVRTNGVLNNDPVKSNDSGCTNINVTNTASIGTDPNAKASARDNSFDLKVIPNPATSAITLDFVAVSSANIEARVVDLVGREVIRKNLGKGYSGQDNFKLDISSLTQGIYFVEVSQDGQKASSKFIKQ